MRAGEWRLEACSVDEQQYRLVKPLDVTDNCAGQNEEESRDATRLGAYHLVYLYSERAGVRVIR